MATASRRRLILEAMLGRVQAITMSNGFETDAGQAAYFGELPSLGDDDPAEAILIVVGDEEPRFQGVNIFVRLPIQVLAVARADLEFPWLAVERIIADIKRAVELADRTLGGLIPQPLLRGATRTLARQPGSTTVGAAVEYSADYREGWGTP